MAITERPAADVGDVRVRVVHTGRSDAPDPRDEIPELGFTEYWYPVCAARNVPRRKPLAWKLLGREVVLYRDGHGGIAMAEDRCPHRSTKLSVGRCHYRGTVSCPYHGWTFDGSGELVAVLSEGPQSTMPGKARLRTYPTRIIKGVLFAWMGDGAALAPEEELPPELFDESVVLSDATIWHANWRPALENFQDNHAPYVHRDSVPFLIRPFPKRSYQGARPVITGGGAHLSSYTDGSERVRPYREWFDGVQGFWPKHRTRMLWVWAFRTRALSWLNPMGKAGKRYGAEAASYHDDPEWANGPHMPGMQRFPLGRTQYNRWCVPIDATTTREFYLHSYRPTSRLDDLIERCKYPFVNRYLQFRNFGLQDGVVLAQTPYDQTERFSPFDVETVAWRRLAILSARHGGRHDRIPADVIARLNGDDRF